MDLYRIILVDDEEEVRQSITRKTDWMGAGFCVVGDAENGEEALEKVEALEPDLIPTDIRMLSMDGLSLAEWVRQKYPSTKIVVFSGHDDFECAKQAIKLNVTEYILKPMDVEELTVILKRIKSNLDDEIERKRSVSLLCENYIRSLPTLRDQFLNELVGSTVSGNVLREKLAEYDIPLAGAKKRTAMVIDIEPEEMREGSTLPLHKERDLIPISVMQVAEEKLGNYCRPSVFIPSRTSWSELVLVVATDEDNSQTGLVDVLGDTCKEIEKILEASTTIGIDHSCQDLGETNCSYKAATGALGYKAVVGAGSIIYINDVEPVSRGELSSDCKDETELIAAIKLGPREKIEEAAQVVMDKMSDAEVHFRRCRAYMLSVSGSVVQLTRQYDLDLEQLTEEGEQQGDTFAVIPRMMKKEDFAHWLFPAALRMNQAMNRERDNTTEQVTQRTKEYIMDNYRDTDLSVEKICRQLHTSPAYFSTMLKKETGQAYTAYLIQVRLDKAVEPLDKTDDKTYVIVVEVGYQEQNYFSYVSKKRLGASSTKFRGTKQIQQACVAAYDGKGQAAQRSRGHVVWKAEG